MTEQVMHECSDCGGLGVHTGWPHTTCPICKGTGQVQPDSDYSNGEARRDDDTTSTLLEVQISTDGVQLGPTTVLDPPITEDQWVATTGECKCGRRIRVRISGHQYQEARRD